MSVVHSVLLDACKHEFSCRAQARDKSTPIALLKINRLRPEWGSDCPYTMRQVIFAPTVSVPQQAVSRVFLLFDFSFLHHLITRFSSSSMSLDRQDARLDAFVSFPSPYTQSLIVQALVKLVPALSLSLVPPSEDKPPRLQW